MLFRSGYKLASRPDIQIMIEAYREAIEASKYRTPAQLRELVIHQLTLHALSEENSPKDKLSALKMLGTVAEVGVFVERKESLVIHESSKVKADLVARLKDIVGNDIKEVDTDTEKLLNTLTRNKPSAEETHAHAPPQNAEIVGSEHLHNIPLTQSPPKNTLSETSKNTTPQDVDFVEEKNEVETFPPKEGVGVDKNVADAGWRDTGNTPLSDLDTMERGGV